ncbi:VOC family protein [Nonlabens ponticola]|uniref:Glyoxalase n=1 Tax=Nonlabens ponticola TaxID=2496866 RepID=A0A3S9MVS2_9FLAO|nr:glyoxalase [Nonlabens ponticola]AZQ43280.1 glyoxalase [Nonlabens ponticola]
MKIKSVRPFIGSADFKTSKEFYLTLGFKELWSSYSMSYFDYNGFGFYLQDAYVKDWVDNTMLFLEVSDLEETHQGFKSLDLKEKFPKSKLSEIVKDDWGDEFFLHDPLGILWHIGTFKDNQ